MLHKLKDHALGQVGQPERIRADKGYPGKRMVAFQKNAISAGTTPIDGIGARRAVRPQKLRVAFGSLNEPARAGGSGRLGQRIFDEVMRGSA